MNVAPIRRPLGCLKALLRQTRQHRQLQLRRAFATAVEATSTSTTRNPILPNYTFQTVGTNSGARRSRTVRKGAANTPRTAFAVYTPPTVVVPPPNQAIATLHAQQIARLDPTGARTHLFSKSNPDSIRVGDVLMVTTRRGAEPFSGVCIAMRRRGIETAILLRSRLTGVGVEMWFKIYSKNVVGIEIVQRARRRARRAKLTFMRHPKHDRGSVEQLVMAWKKSRNVMKTKSGNVGKNGGKGKKGAKK